MPKSYTWRKGPPPSIGWWPASYSKDNNIFRWWNGTVWSLPCTRKFTAERAGRTAARAAHALWTSDHIYWRPRPSNWPERSRT